MRGMYDRATIVDQNFIEQVSSGKLPDKSKALKLQEVGIQGEEVVDLLESMVMSRHLDFAARKLKTTGDSFYTIGSSGHEGNAVIGKVFSKDDLAFLHYRSGALMIQRAKQLGGSTPLYDLLLSFVASSEDPISGGRHKVFGSVELNVPPQTSTIASHLPKAVGAAFSIPRAKSCGIQESHRSEGLVICNFGDASSNHATALCAFNSAGWCSFQNIPMPILFICEDNGLGISVKTPENWVEESFRNRPGIKYFKCDGLNVLEFYQTAVKARDYIMRTRRPAFLHVKVVRLLGHAGSDIESSYHSQRQIELKENDDPLLHTASLVLARGLATKNQILDMYESVRDRIEAISAEVVNRPKLEKIEDVQKPIFDLPIKRQAPSISEKDLTEKNLGGKIHMGKLLNFALHDIMAQYKNTVVFGEDVAKKGGVYHVTAGLFKRYGEKRVFNTLLDETTIIGIAIGMAHNGFLPMPEVQFLAYFHNAEDQIRGEAATLSFFSQGQFQNPMVLRIAGLAYQKGFGGHFHNDNSLAIFRDIPGIVVACPSNGADAVKMLRACVKEAYEKGRVCVFVEPIALYMTRDLHEKDDGLWLHEYPAVSDEMEVGELGVYEEGSDYAIVTYGNGVYYSRQAMHEVKQRGKLIDLRWLAPLNEKDLLKSLEGVDKVLVVDECRETGSQSEQIIKLIALHQPKQKLAVVAGADSFVPLGKASTAGLPGKEDIKAGIEGLFV